MIPTLSIRTWLRLGAAVMVLVALAWVGWHLRAGALAEAEAARLAAQLQAHEQAAALRARVAAAEAVRLAGEEQDRLTFGRLSDEALSDPDAAAPALGLRSVDRLNAIR